ncbi:hypothetical protein SCUCBS95973_005989 [Sporothrix curviconia]|uniref:Haloacid dehalogenase n=1 Tax=Sporothrix curviconia TaxID=1260050 RepID=A0ABP0C2H1_9PEZI
MAKRNLLLAFDAFGTLFRLKQPIERQYGDVARQHFPGLLATSSSDPDRDTGSDIGDTLQFRAAFRDAFRAQARAHPNYGHRPDGEGMGATAWWTAVIHNTFQPLLARGQTIPPELAPRLLARFASSEGYTMDPKLPAALRRLKEDEYRLYDRIVVGVITNSDDRVPGILSSFGVRVSPLRYGHAWPEEAGTKLPQQTDYDIDFHCMSYDVGVEKPDPAIFRAAESLVPSVLGGGGGASTDSTDVDVLLNPENWDKVYVGDEAGKDVAGAQAAGWHAVLLAGERAETDELESKYGPASIQQVFGPPEEKTVVHTRSAASFLDWLWWTSHEYNYNAGEAQFARLGQSVGDA